METIRYTCPEKGASQDEGAFLTDSVEDTFAKKVYHEDTEQHSYYIRLDRQGEPIDPASLGEYQSPADARASIRYKQVSKEVFADYLVFLRTKSVSMRSQITRQII